MLKIGLDKCEITASEPGLLMLGWAHGDNVIDGVAAPLYARAMVVEDGGGATVAYVCADLCFISQAIRDAVIERLGDRHAAPGLDEHHVMLTATHTHSGPSGISAYLLYNIMGPGVAPRVLETIVDGIVTAIVGAHSKRRAARLHIAQGEVPTEAGIAFNRSWRAYNANHDVQPVAEATRALATDRRMTVLRVEDEDGRSMGIVDWFALHGTCVHHDNRWIHPDHKGLASSSFERESDGFVAIFAQEAAGDVTPNYRRCERRGIDIGVDDDDFESARRVADVQVRHARALFTKAREDVGDGVDAVLRNVDMGHVEVARAFTSGGGNERTERPSLGLAMAHGTDEGPGPLHAAQWVHGSLRSATRLFRRGDAKVPFLDLANGVDGAVLGVLDPTNPMLLSFPDPSVRYFKSLVRSGALRGMPWAPSIVPIQIVRIGSLAIVALPCEPTTVAGRRIRAALASRLARIGVRHIVVNGYANAYAGYLTTPEEYDVQRYEGACTLYGRATLPAYQSVLEGLATELGSGTRAKTVGPARHRFSGDQLERLAYRRTRGPSARSTRSTGRRTTPTVPRTRPREVVVIGGGFSGITAAHELVRRGQRVVLLEASDRLGGRALSVDAPGWPEGHRVDSGAHYFGVAHRRVLELAKRLCRPEEIVSRDAMYGPDPAFRGRLGERWITSTRSTSFLDVQGLTRESPIGDHIAIFRSVAVHRALERTIDVEAPWRSIGARRLDAMTFQDWIDGQRLPTWIAQMWAMAAIGILSAHARQISMLYWLWYNAANGGVLQCANDYAGGPQELSLTCGLGTLLERYAGRLDADVRTGMPVRHIDHRRSDRVAVTCEDGAVFEADHVIVAVTPHAVGRHISFTPDVSEARKRFHAQPTGHAIKATIRYDAPWWRDSHGKHFMSYFGGPDSEGVEWCLDTSNPNGTQYSLTVFVSDVLADRHPNGDAMKRALLDRMVELTGDPRARFARHVEAFDWRRTRFVGGGPTTFCGPGVLSAMGDTFHRPEGPGGRVRFACAEYATEFPGYVEGAMAAGERVAARIVDQRVESRRRRARRFLGAAVARAFDGVDLVLDTRPRPL